MQFKIDENLHSDAADLLGQHGHDALTVFDQGLRGHADGDIASICQQESRAIVTLDLDFSDIRVYPPGDYEGIIVLRLNDQSRASVLQVLERIIPLFDVESLAGRLWIVNEHQVRIRGGNPPTAR
jgi:predicted nuclease of predicted toxin-antitoxin system